MTLDMIHNRLDTFKDPTFMDRYFQLWNESKPFELAIGKSILGRNFCITEKGYVGWVSSTTQEGDWVAAFRGKRILFTLKEAEVEGRYRLTGDCFLQGLMEGESLKKAEFVDKDIIIV